MKLGISEIQEAMARSHVDPKQQEQVINHLQEVIKELEAEKEQQNPTPKLKNKFGLLLLDEAGDIKVENLAGFIYQIQEDSDYNTVMDRLRAAVKVFNQTKKGQKNPCKSVLDAFASIAPKILKAEGIIRKSKDLINVQKIDGKI